MVNHNVLKLISIKFLKISYAVLEMGSDRPIIEYNIVI